MNFDKYKFTKYFGASSESRWADKSEIITECEKIDLSADKYYCAGIPMINDGKTAYVDDKDNHSLIFGSTGSKKSRLFCMPTLRFIIGAGESFIVTDPKGELYERTSGAAKANGYNVVVLNYRDLKHSDCWNPFAVPYKLYHSGDKEAAISRLNDFINAISEKHEKGSKDVFWINAAKSVALSIVITMLEVCTFEECNLKTFTRFCVEFAKGVTDAVSIKLYNLEDSDIIKNYLFDLMQLVPSDSIARLNYDGIAGSSDKAKGDVQSMLFTVVGIFLSQEALLKNMSMTSFDIDTIGTQKTALYLIVPDERTSYHFIATTFIKQCYELLIIKAQEHKNRQLPVRVNFVLDEFANIPKVPDMPAMISAARSRNIRFFLVLQSMHQMREKYGEDADTIKGNCENWVFLSSKEHTLLKEISALCGQVTHTIDGRSEKQPLISISQLQRLNKTRGEALIFCGRQYPFISEMADIDDCEFTAYPPIELKSIKMGEMVSSGPREILNRIMKEKQNMPYRNKTISSFCLDENGNYVLKSDENYVYDEDRDDFDDEDFLSDDWENSDDESAFSEYDEGDYESFENWKERISDSDGENLFDGSGDDGEYKIVSSPETEKIFANKNSSPYESDNTNVGFIETLGGKPLYEAENDKKTANENENSAIQEHFIYQKLNNEDVHICNYYDILENDDGEILIMIKYEGKGFERSPSSPTLYYDGKEHAVFISDSTQPIICDYVASGIREKLHEIKEILFAFAATDESGGEDDIKISAEFMVPVSKMEDVSVVAQYYIDLTEK